MKFSFLASLALAFAWGLWCATRFDGPAAFVVGGVGALLLGIVASHLERIGDE